MHFFINFLNLYPPHWYFIYSTISQPHQFQTVWPWISSLVSLHPQFPYLYNGITMVPTSIVLWGLHELCVCVCVFSCVRLCDPVDCSLPGSSVHGISQARILLHGCAKFVKFVKRVTYDFLHFSEYISVYLSYIQTQYISKKVFRKILIGKINKEEKYWRQGIQLRDYFHGRDNELL